MIFAPSFGVLAATISLIVVASSVNASRRGSCGSASVVSVVFAMIFAPECLKSLLSRLSGFASWPTSPRCARNPAMSTSIRPGRSASRLRASAIIEARKNGLVFSLT